MSHRQPVRTMEPNASSTPSWSVDWGSGGGSDEQSNVSSARATDNGTTGGRHPFGSLLQYGEEDTYRDFTTSAQILIFIGSVLGISKEVQELQVPHHKVQEQLLPLNHQALQPEGINLLNITHHPNAELILQPMNSLLRMLQVMSSLFIAYLFIIVIFAFVQFVVFYTLVVCPSLSCAVFH